MKRTSKILFTTLCLAVMSTYAAAQLKLSDVLKVGGAVAVVNTFGGQINSAFNKLQNHKDNQEVATKVVTIVTIGINASKAIGAAQVMGAPDKVKECKAVAQVEGNLLGIRIRALIPISSDKSIKRVDGVGVSGIVDLKL